MDSKFNVNETVKVVNYGHLVWIHEKGVAIERDLLPELVGRIATIKEKLCTQGKWKYALNGLTKTAWYDEKQLEKILPASEG